MKKTKINGFNKKKMIFSLLCLLFAIIILVAAGCAASPSKGELAGRGAGGAIAPQTAPDEAEVTLDAAYSIAEDGAKPDLPDSSRQYIIRNAHLTLIITDIEEAAKAIQHKTAQLQGYVASLELYDLTRERRAGRISLRIPGDKFDAALAMLEEVGEIKNQSFSEQDVTLQYIDLEARIATMEAQEERLRELLDRAEKVEEVLEVEKELWRVRGNLESMIAEFQHLQQRVSYSSIEIYLEEKDPLTTSLVEDLGTWEKVVNLLALNTNRLFKGISNFIVVSIGSLPILVPLVLLFLILRKITMVIKERKKTRAQDQQEQKEKVLEG